MQSKHFLNDLERKKTVSRALYSNAVVVSKNFVMPSYLSNSFIGMPKLSTMDFLIVSSAVCPVWLRSAFLASWESLLKNSGLVTILQNHSSNTPTRTKYNEK